MKKSSICYLRLPYFWVKILGIFEEEGNDQRRRGKREIREHIISFAKYLLWIDQTIERGNANLFRYPYTNS